jgi:hypothetical protein
MGFDVNGTEKTIPAKTAEVEWMEYKDPSDPWKGLTKVKDTIITTPEKKVFSMETITPIGSSGGNIDLKLDTINDKIGSTVTSPTTGTIDTGSGKNTPKDKTFKEKDKKEKKLYEDEFDRYRDITTALDDYNRELEETQELKDELWGADRLAAMDAEKKKLGEITAKQREYIKAISGEDGKGGYLKADIDALKQLDSDAKFDENGNLLNYHELTQKWLDEMNVA